MAKCSSCNGTGKSGDTQYGYSVCAFCKGSGRGAGSCMIILPIIVSLFTFLFFMLFWT